MNDASRHLSAKIHICFSMPGRNKCERIFRIYSLLCYWSCCCSSLMGFAFCHRREDCLSRWILFVLQFDRPFLLPCCLALNWACVNCQMYALWEGPSMKRGQMDIWEHKDESLPERDRHDWKIVIYFPKSCAASVFCMSCVPENDRPEATRRLQEIKEVEKAHAHWEGGELE